MEEVLKPIGSRTEIEKIGLRKPSKGGKGAGDANERG